MSSGTYTTVLAMFAVASFGLSFAVESIGLVVAFSCASSGLLVCVDAICREIRHSGAPRPEETK